MKEDIYNLPYKKFVCYWEDHRRLGSSIEPAKKGYYPFIPNIRSRLEAVVREVRTRETPFVDIGAGNGNIMAWMKYFTNCSKVLGIEVLSGMDRWAKDTWGLDLTIGDIFKVNYEIPNQSLVYFYRPIHDEKIMVKLYRRVLKLTMNKNCSYVETLPPGTTLDDLVYKPRFMWGALEFEEYINEFEEYYKIKQEA